MCEWSVVLAQLPISTPGGPSLLTLYSLQLDNLKRPTFLPHLNSFWQSKESRWVCWFVKWRQLNLSAGTTSATQRSGGGGSRRKDDHDKNVIFAQKCGLWDKLYCICIVHALLPTACSCYQKRLGAALLTVRQATRASSAFRQPEIIDKQTESLTRLIKKSLDFHKHENK